MAFNLLSLLGQAAGVGALDEELLNGPYAEDGSTEIRVSARPRYDPRSDPEPPNFGDPAPRPEITPRYVLNDDRMQPTQEELQEILPRSGRFGVKGTLRDILGTLGDAFLLQGGADRIYEPRRQLEREADAMFGFTGNPIEAIERLAAAGDTKGAQALYNNILTQQHNARTLESQEAARKNLSDDRDWSNKLQARNQVARWLQAANTPEKRAVALKQAERLAAELGLTVADLGITGELTDDLVSVLSAGDMTVNQQVQIPFTERRVATGEYNAQTGRINATRPRPAPRPRAQTELEYYQDIANIPANRRTKEQNDFMQKYIKGTRGSSSILEGLTIPPPPGGSGSGTRSRFRPVN